MSATVREKSAAAEEQAPQLPLRKRILFLMILFVAGLALAEVAARVVDAFSDISIEEHRSRYLYRRHCRLGEAWSAQRGDYPYLPYIPNSEDPRVNELGFRGEEITAGRPPDTYRIICIGGSTTWDEYPAHLQDELEGDFARRGLKLEVINAGDVSWTTMESLINFITRCMPLKPDAIIVYHAINDALASFGDTYSLDYSHWRSRLEKDKPRIWDRLPLWLDHSAAYVGFRAVFERKVPTIGFEKMTVKYRTHFEEDRYHGMEAFRQNLLTIISIARARGIEVFLCPQVFNYEYRYRQSLKRWGDAVADANEIARWFADRWDDVHLIDVAGSLEAGNDWMTDSCHFTPEGKQRVARFIGDRLRLHIDRLVETRGDPLDVASLVPHKQSKLAGGPPAR